MATMMTYITSMAANTPNFTLSFHNSDKIVNPLYCPEFLILFIKFAYPGTYLMQSMHYLERFEKIQDGNQGGH